MNLWLDDYRAPPIKSELFWEWAKTADEAIAILKKGNIEFASLDHDLAEEHYYAYDGPGDKEDKQFKEKTGMAVLDWMQENNVWPVAGVRIHTMNTARKPIMLALVQKIYGRTFQYQYPGTAKV